MLIINFYPMVFLWFSIIIVFMFCGDRLSDGRSEESKESSSAFLSVAQVWLRRGPRDEDPSAIDEVGCGNCHGLIERRAPILQGQVVLNHKTALLDSVEPPADHPEKVLDFLRTGDEDSAGCRIARSCH